MENLKNILMSDTIMILLSCLLLAIAALGLVAIERENDLLRAEIEQVRLATKELREEASFLDQQRDAALINPGR